MSGLAVPIATAKSLVDQIQSIREERDRLKVENEELQAKLSAAYHTAEVRYGERVIADEQLAALRAKAKELLDAGGSPSAMCEVAYGACPAGTCELCDRYRAAEAALRAEVERG